jgi:RNA polymerase sigma-70 factor (ECF subfamily)
MTTDTRVNRTLLRAARGDEDAWREILEVYGRRVFGLIRAKCGDGDLAEEITQSCFCTVAQKLYDGDYLEQGKFEAWLFRIAMNRLRDEMRRRGRQAAPTDAQTLAAMVDHHGGRPASGTDAATSSGGERLRSSGVEVAALMRALSDLPEADIEIIHLRHQGGLAFRQIADVLDEPLGTVLARHHRALKKLRDSMQEPPQA